MGITVEEAPVTLQLDGVDRELAVGAHTLRRKRRSDLAGGRRMTLLIAVADAEADREVVASARALAAAARWDVRAVHVREPGVPSPAAPTSKASTSRPSRATRSRP